MLVRGRVYSWFTPCKKEQHNYTYNVTNMIHVTTVYLVKRSHSNYTPVG